VNNIFYHETEVFCKLKQKVFQQTISTAFGKKLNNPDFFAAKATFRLHYLNFLLVTSHRMM